MGGKSFSSKLDFALAFLLFVSVFQLLMANEEAKPTELNVLQLPISKGFDSEALDEVFQGVTTRYGGECSFSTLCFALALHEMTEAPFRAMDEFDVFMDDVCRKISLDTVVDFALAQGSQWIFITPHDIR
ncbi:hypothetical protein K7X08_016895 [Anisodus acutangulus]|uniref:Uncharacterized protein n=1 Tax=Anisodus acutangulus TaxID=402998 RepID=A0A9Q1R4H3_9SOLA|nr:hypothetical protein K7X08_016895 [Anisodus acutangulus]